MEQKEEEEKKEANPRFSAIAGTVSAKEGQKYITKTPCQSQHATCFRGKTSSLGEMR